MDSDPFSRETTSYFVSQARSSKERALAFLLWSSLLAHGLFFPRELAVMALIPGGYFLWRRHELWAALYSPGFSQEGLQFSLGATDLLLLLMSGLSFLGLLHPVKADEAWLEGMRFLLYWFVYRWGREVAQEPKLENKLLKTVAWAAFALAVSVWFPWSGRIWPSPGPPEAGRLSSWFGYPNATAAFLGAVLLLPGLNGGLKGILFLAFLSTGSRASLALFLVIKVFQWVSVLQRSRKLPKQSEGRKLAFIRALNFPLRPSILGVAVLVGLALLGWGSLVGMTAPFHGAWEHLKQWGDSASLRERLLYIQDGLILAWRGKLLPQAGGWLAFPLVQQIPYWAADPHFGLIRILLDQGLPGLLAVAAWSAKRFSVIRRSNLFGACLFLALHSLVDADFSFAALGIFFWLLVALAESGLSHGGGHAQSRLARTRILKPAFLQAVLALALFAPAAVFLAAGGLPQAMEVLNQGQVGGAEAKAAVREQGVQTHLEEAVILDRSNITWHRQLAEIELNQGEIVPGLQEVERALAWDKFDLGSYEWAQGVILQAAEEQQSLGNSSARRLYQWVTDVPARIAATAQAVPVAERPLWKGYGLFRVTPQIKLLADQARVRLLQMP